MKWSQQLLCEDIRGMLMAYMLSRPRVEEDDVSVAQYTKRKESTELFSSNKVMEKKMTPTLEPRRYSVDLKILTKLGAHEKALSNCG